MCWKLVRVYKVAGVTDKLSTVDDGSETRSGESEKVGL